MHILSLILLVTLSLFVPKTSGGDIDSDSASIHQLWTDCRLKDVLKFEVFDKAILGYNQIGNLKNKNIITIVDFSLPSTIERLFVIDIEKRKLLFKCLTSHGKNSGENFATNFSNKSESLESSLGFFLTAETYKGKHGYSLKLDGLEKGINDNARTREIVIHGADYVSEKYIRQVGRLGRSWGCLALAPEILKEVVAKISNGSVLFIYADDKQYKENSSFGKESRNKN